MGKKNYLETNVPIFDNDAFIERACKTTALYNYSFENCLYLRFCFLVFYFEVDLCRIHEKNVPHTYPKEKYDFKKGLEKTEKVFFSDVPRSNKSKISLALQPFVDTFLKAVKEKKFYGLFPEVREYMRDLLFKNDIHTIVSNYESFTVFLYKMVSYLDQKYTYTETDEDDITCDSIMCTYSSYRDFYIDCLNNRYTSEVWKDVLQYPIYTNLEYDTMINEISNNTNYWNLIFENWHILMTISDDIFIWDTFKFHINKNKRDIVKQIDSLFTGNVYARADFLLNSASKYSYILSFKFNVPRRKTEYIQKLATQKVNTIKESYCFNFCKENMPYIQKLDTDNIQLLFRIACLGAYTRNEVPQIDLNNFTESLINLNKQN